MENFPAWLLNELDHRGWQPADLARRAGVSKGSISNILNSNRKAGSDLCLAIAKALGEPPEKVFRLAGILPSLPAPDDPALGEAIDILRSMSPEQRRKVLDYLRFIYQKGQEDD